MASHNLPYVVGAAATTAATTVILFCGVSACDQTQPILSLSVNQNPIQATSASNHGITYDRYTLIEDEQVQYKENIETIYNFASNLLENIEDLPPEFSEVIDDNFWDLI